MLILPPQAEPRPQLQGSIGLMEYFLLLTEDSNLSEVLVLYWASITTCISSVTMVGFSNWAKYNKILSLAQVFTVSQVQALLLVCTMSNVQVMAYCHHLLPLPRTTPTGLHLQNLLALLSRRTLLAPLTALLNWRSLSPSCKVSNCRSATTLGCFLLLSGFPRQWRLMVAVALTGDKMYCLGV